MTDRPKLLLLDDDPDMLEIYREILQRLPSAPTIQTATTGTKAIALMETQPFQIIVADLNLPRMSGMEVLTVVRRRWPHVSTVRMTAVFEDKTLQRAEGIGVDLCARKPGTSREIEAFLASIDSLVQKGIKLVGLEAGTGNTGRLEIPRLEPPSHTSLSIHPGSGAGDGQGQGERGESAAVSQVRLGGAALRNLVPQPGRGEIIPGPPAAEHRMAGGANEPSRQPGATAGQSSSRNVPASQLARVEGVQMVLSLRVVDSDPELDSWGAENPEEVGHWLYTVMRRFHALGEQLQTGSLVQVDCLGATQHLALVPRGEDSLLVALPRTQSLEQSRNVVKQVTTQWAS